MKDKTKIEISGNVCISYLLLCSKLPQIKWLKIIHIYYLTAVMGQEFKNSLAETSAQVP